MTLQEYIARCRSMRARMTPGEWGTEDDVNPEMITAGTDENGAYIYTGCDCDNADNQNGIITIVNEYLLLLAVVEALHRELYGGFSSMSAEAVAETRYARRQYVDAAIDALLEGK